MKLSKCYNQFHQIGDTRYHEAKTEDSDYLIIESFIATKRKVFGILVKDELPQNIQILDVSTILDLYFNNLIITSFNTMEEKEFKGEIKENVIVNHINMNDFRESIVSMFNAFIDNAVTEAIDTHKKRSKIFDEKEKEMVPEEFANIKKELRKQLDEQIKTIKSKNPIHNGNIILRPTIVAGKIKSRTIKYLFGELVSRESYKHTLVECDLFGNVTVYNVLESRGKLKRVDSFLLSAETIIKYYEKKGEKE